MQQREHDADQTNHSVVVVDDDEGQCELLAQIAGKAGHDVRTAGDGYEALAELKLGADLVLLDGKMPGIDGFEVVQRMRQNPNTRHIPVIMITALDSKTDRLRALEAGANEFISKPVDPTELKVRMRTALRLKATRDKLRQQRDELEKIVEQRTAELRESLHEAASAEREAHSAHKETLYCLALAAEYRDQDTGAHVRRVGKYAALLGHLMHLAPTEVEILEHTAPIHDVGKIAIPDAVLLKPGGLDDDEWEIMKQHTVAGTEILAGSDTELLRAACIIARSHHEKWDGTGYPDGLAGEDIPLYGRICAVADVFDALTTDRPYRGALPVEKAREILADGKGSHFDPELVDLFIEHFAQVIEIRDAHTD